ncbi:hypothetical protein FACS1894166_12510 [Bacilli bacterium]|nr:hypothetical protein FACS1894166_12510 [Bacilli bacterium]
MIKDSLILKKIEELENANDVDFATIKEEDIKHCIVGVFYNPQAEYKN